MSGALFELPEDVKKKLGELKALSDKAKGGDKDARRELRKAVRESSPEVIAQASSFAQHSEQLLVETMAAGKPLLAEGLAARAELMRQEIAGDNPTPLEVLLAERVVAYWLLLTFLEGTINANYSEKGKAHRVSMRFVMQIVKWQESVHRKYLSSIRELTQVRKLQSNTPSIQVNTQVNLLGGSRAAQKRHQGR